MCCHHSMTLKDSELLSYQNCNRGRWLTKTWYLACIFIKNDYTDLVKLFWAYTDCQLDLKKQYLIYWIQHTLAVIVDLEKTLDFKQLTGWLMIKWKVRSIFFKKWWRIWYESHFNKFQFDELLHKIKILSNKRKLTLMKNDIELFCRSNKIL